MSSRFRSEIRRYVIYCILDDMNYTVYVTKSYSKTPKKQYSAHINDPVRFLDALEEER